jgi:hypothetical protein
MADAGCSLRGISFLEMRHAGRRRVDDAAVDNDPDPLLAPDRRIHLECT